jgi:hypothetical protein
MYVRLYCASLCVVVETFDEDDDGDGDDDEYHGDGEEEMGEQKNRENSNKPI